MKTAIIDNAETLYWASFNRFELRLPGSAVAGCAHPGQCDADVAYYAPIVRAQMDADNFRNKPTPDSIRAELAEYGAWDDAELADDDANWLRLVWCAACNVAESDDPDSSEPVK
jgi:hypothetical protein